MPQWKERISKRGAIGSGVRQDGKNAKISPYLIAQKADRTDTVPDGGGYHTIPSPRRFGLPVSRPVPNTAQSEEIYLTTFAHELHCIGVLREALLAEGRQTQYHIFHCLEKRMYTRTSLRPYHGAGS